MDPLTYRAAGVDIQAGDLAGVLTNLSDLLSEIGRQDEALRAAEEIARALSDAAARRHRRRPAN